MISKTDFLKFCDRVEKTERGILALENAFGGIVLRESEFCALPNFADQVAMMLLEVPQEESDFFVDSFWNIVDGETVEYWPAGVSTDEPPHTIESWEQFYDYWR